MQVMPLRSCRLNKNSRRSRVMSKSRMEIFSDAVFAIIMTIMVLELKVPHGVDLAALSAVLPVFLSYVLSFIYLGIYWNNHHHLLSVTHEVSGGILWANLHLLFWLSLIPFASGWMGENRFRAAPDRVVWSDSVARRLRVFAAAT